MFILLKAGVYDYSESIIEGSYKVYKNEVTFDWEDGNHKKHHEILRYRTSGSFQMMFNSWTEYKNFVDALELVRAGSEYTLTVFAQNANTQVSSTFFLKLPPELRQKNDSTFSPGKFTITIEEA